MLGAGQAENSSWMRKCRGTFGRHLQTRPAVSSFDDLDYLSQWSARRGRHVAFRIAQPQQDLRNPRSPDGSLQFALQRHDLDRMAQIRRLQAMQPGRQQQPLQCLADNDQV